MDKYDNILSWLHLPYNVYQALFKVTDVCGTLLYLEAEVPDDQKNIPYWVIYHILDAKL